MIPLALLVMMLAATMDQAQARGGFYGWHPHLTHAQGYAAVVVGCLTFGHLEK